jgi:hypothetical protein
MPSVRPLSRRPSFRCRWRLGSDALFAGDASPPARSVVPLLAPSKLIGPESVEAPRRGTPCDASLPRRPAHRSTRRLPRAVLFRGLCESAGAVVARDSSARKKAARPSSGRCSRCGNLCSGSQVKKRAVVSARTAWRPGRMTATARPRRVSVTRQVASAVVAFSMAQLTFRS